MSDNRVSDRVEIHLKYEGPEVDRGTMALHDVIPVLQGFAGAYASLAAVTDPDARHHMEIAAVQQGSADIVLEVWKLLSEPPSPGLETGIVAGSIAFEIVSRIFEIAKLKTHVGNKPATEHIEAHNSVVVVNADGGQLSVSFPNYEIYKQGTLDKNLERLTRPLEPGRIDAADFEVRARDGETTSHRITAAERPYFELEDIVAASTQELTISATLNSLTKSTNSGYLYINGERRVFYRYLGEDHAKLHAIFGSHNGLVEIRCTAHLDDKLEPVSLDVHSIERLQTGLFDGE